MIEQKLGIQFKNKALLKEALTPAHGSKPASYERLEFLGDRVLGLSIANALLKTHPLEKEGDIAKRFTALVQEKSLAGIANGLALSDDIMTTNAELKTNASVLSDVLEALLGAVFLDAGFDAADTLIQRLFETLLTQEIKPPVDAKTALQEWAHKQKFDLPIYTIVDRTGPEHDPYFTVSVNVADYGEVFGRGKSKRLAEQEAAEKFLNEHSS